MTTSFLDIPIEQVLVFGNMRAAVFYKTIEWKRARYHAMAIHGNSCQMCGASPSSGVQIHVDHIKPRFLYPELCFDIGNLQVLCADCHAAKGVEFIDDFRSKKTQVNPVRMREFFRIQEKHLILAIRPPRTKPEVIRLCRDIQCENKKQRRRWNRIVEFMFAAKIKYPQMASMTVDELTECKQGKSQALQKFYFDKQGGDAVFTIADCEFPKDITELLPNRLVNPELRSSMRGKS